VEEDSKKDKLDVDDDAVAMQLVKVLFDTL
jgi:hypothetical protein